MNNEAELREKVRELFQLVQEQLEPQLTKLIRSGVGILDDEELHGKDGRYLVAKAFVAAFMDDQVYRLENALHDNHQFHELMENYSKFL